MTRYKNGAADIECLTVRSSDGTPGIFCITEYYARLPKKDEYDALLILGITMNHNLANQDIVNSFAWNGRTKKGRSVSFMKIQKIFLQMEQPQSRTNEYTEIQTTVCLVDHGDDYMPDLGNQGVIAFGWLTNMYFANGADDVSQNKLEVWNGAALLDMNNYLYGAVHNRSANFYRNAPLKYEYDDLYCKRPIFFYHMTNNYSTDQHSAYTRAKVIAKVRFFASEKSMKHAE